jgi:hypothetical protein
MVGLLDLHDLQQNSPIFDSCPTFGPSPRGGLARQADGVGGGAGGERFRKQRFAGHFFKRSLSTGTEHWLFQTESFTT